MVVGGGLCRAVGYLIANISKTDAVWVGAPPRQSQARPVRPVRPVRSSILPFHSTPLPSILYVSAGGGVGWWPLVVRVSQRSVHPSLLIQFGVNERFRSDLINRGRLMPGCDVL